MQPDLTQGQQLYQQARCRIPGGTQLLSKRPEMFLLRGGPTTTSGRRARRYGTWTATATLT